MEQKIEDPIVLAVMTKFYERSQVGIKKYNTTLERNDLSTLEWLNHAQEEAMDFVLYLERLKDEYKSNKLEWLVKNCFIPDVSNLLCGSFEPDNKTSSATRCKCGREKWEHPKAT